jgi:hypothetical protein
MVERRGGVYPVVLVHSELRRFATALQVRLGRAARRSGRHVAAVRRRVEGVAMTTACRAGEWVALAAAQGCSAGRPETHLPGAARSTEQQ